MKISERIANYHRQNGAQRLRPKQRRRLIHKGAFAIRWAGTRPETRTEKES